MAKKKDDSIDDDGELFDNDDENDDVDDDDEGDDESPIEDGDDIDVAPQPQTRRERRNSRVAEHAANEVLARLAPTLERMNAALSQQYQQQQQRPEQPQVRPEEERINAELQDVYRQQDNLTSAWSAKLQSGAATAEEIANFQKQARELNERQSELIVERASTRRAQPQQDPQALQREIIRQNYQARHGDVVTHQNRRAIELYAEGVYRQRIAEGRQDSQELQDEAMDAARERFGMKRKYTRGNPTKQEKSRMTGPSSRPGGSEGSVKVTPSMRRMAEQAFGHIKDERKRLQHYIKLVKNKGGDL